MEEMALEVQKFISRHACNRPRALLPQYVGKAVYEIFDVSPNTAATAAADNPFEQAVEALINYFTTHKKNESLRIMYSYKQSKNP